MRPFLRIPRIRDDRGAEIKTHRERSKIMFDVKKEVPEAPLYRQQFEHDNCGIGACVNIKGTKSRATVENALKIVET